MKPQPRIPSPELAQKLELLRLEGWSCQMSCGKMGYAYSTVMVRSQKSPELKAVMDRFKEDADNKRISKRLYS